MQVSEEFFLDSWKEYQDWQLNNTLLEKYPKLSGKWTKDMTEFLQIRLEETNKLQKPLQKQEKEEEKPKTIWKL